MQAQSAESRQAFKGTLNVIIATALTTDSDRVSGRQVSVAR